MLQLYYSRTAHINSSDIFKDSAFSGAYKKKLLSDDVLSIVGLSDYGVLGEMESNIKFFRNKNSSRIQFVLDNDAHDVDSVDRNVFWVKGAKRSFTTLKEAFNDYDISVEFGRRKNAKQYIEGIYVENCEKGFLCDKDNNGFFMCFSNALNCLIGGRGTGKSTVLELIEYVLSQRCDDEKKLDFLCSNGDTWILYKYNLDEYLIEMNMPCKGRSDDNFLRCFGQNPEDKYHYYYNYDEDEIRRYANRYYLRIFKVIKENDEIYLDSVSDKASILSEFFDVRYSVNELVKTASSSTINKYIYDTVFENRILSKPQDVIRFKSKSGLKKVLVDVKGVLEKRKEQVNFVLDSFNQSQKGILRIVYSQNGSAPMPDFQKWLFGNSYSSRRWYESYNITEDSILQYLFTLYDKLGAFDFLSLISDADTKKALNKVDFIDYCIEMNQRMIENGIKRISNKDIPNILEKIFDKMLSSENIRVISDFLKQYVSSVEDFSLEFNINNKEGQTGTPIFKSVRMLSLGQKVVAMLSFVLGYSKYSSDYRPLIIDQPEDNLDNRYIYKNLVHQLRTIKDDRQIIIATHNATIVTNAKADQVCVMESDNKHGWVKATGYPGDINIKKHIINHLEGGIESFKHKMSIYENALNK